MIFCTACSPTQQSRVAAIGGVMRWVYLAVIVLFAVAMLIFVLQNHEFVTTSFLGFSIRAPLAVLLAGVYFIGALTGGGVFAFLRRSYQGSQQAPAVTR